MIAEKLRKSILQAAIQGNLTEQRSEDGDARELLAEIKAEKAQLVKEGKIKKEKPLPEITEEEIPFDIPDNWCWMRLGEVITLKSGQDMTPDKYSSIEKGIPYITGASNFVNGILNIDRWTLVPRAVASAGDLLITCKGTIGEMAFLKQDTAHIARQVMAIKPLDGADIRYIRVYLEFYVSELKAMAKSMIPGISRDMILMSLVPLPPLAEQQRIVLTIERALEKIEDLEKDELKIQLLQKSFPKKMKDSLLQAAVQGKLTEQLESDGDARALVADIQKEKARLIKEGKIKKEKALPEITEEEIPFEIPENWCWVRLGDIIRVQGGKRIPVGKKLTSINTGYKYIRVADMHNGTILNNDIHYVPLDVYPQIKNYTISSDDVYITCAGTIGRVGTIPEEYDGSNLTENADKLVFRLLNKNWLVFFMASPFIQMQISECTTKVGQPKLAIKRIENFIIPVPPLAEQQRIVERLEQFLPLCDALE